MGFRPPSVRRSAPSSAKGPSAPDAPRAVRPIPERTAPHRTPEQLFRTEEPTPPIADAVSKAYQVFDRYLKEGQEYAAGQSAWYTGQGTPGMPSGDVLSAAMWLFEQMRGMGQNLPAIPNMPSIPNVAQAVAQTANWPEPRWGTTNPATTNPVTTNPVLQAKPPPTKWAEERFDDEGPAAAGGPPVNRAYAWNKKPGS